ncbi:MAG: hypothetical protein ACREJQ_02235 [bacterium]
MSNKINPNSVNNDLRHELEMLKWSFLEYDALVKQGPPLPGFVDPYPGTTFTPSEYGRRAPPTASDAQRKAIENWGAKKNWFIECFLLHARNLTGFFWAIPKPHDDDIVASRLYADWETVRPCWDHGQLQHLVNEISGTLSHLTTRRNNKVWDNEIRQMMNKFRGALEKLIEAANQDKFQDKSVQAAVASLDPV